MYSQQMVMANFILIQFGDNEELMMNPNCRQINFMGYLREKCQYDKGAVIDLIDEDGNLSMVHTMGKDENVRANFNDRMNYVPVLIEKNPDEVTLKKVKPLLNDWEKLFPQLEKKIKILTGELKRGGKKSPTNKGMSQRGLDRKASRVDRSSSNLQRGSVSQAGRYSTAKLSSASVAGKFDKKGSKIGKGKKK